MSNLLWILRNAAFMKWSLLCAVVLCFLDMISLLGITGIQKWLIDSLFLENHNHGVTNLLFVFGILIIIYNIVHYLSFMLNRSNMYRFQKKLSVSLLNYIYGMKVARYQNERVGNLAQRFSGDVEESSVFIANYLPEGIASIFKFLILAMFIGWTNPLLLILVLVTSLACIILMRIFAPKYKNIGRKTQESNADVLVQIEECISSTREVIAFQRTDWELKKYNRVFASLFSLLIQEGKLANKQMVWTEAFRWSIIIVLLGYSAYLAVTTQISVGTFVVIYLIANQYLEGLNSTLRFLMTFSFRLGAIERMKEFISVTEKKGEEVLKEKVSEICFRNLSFSYSENSTAVLTDLNLTLPIGKKIAFVGLSGSGKSTIAYLMSRLYEPSKGDILVNGKKLTLYSIKSWRGKVNMVSQDSYFFSDTIKSNLTMGRDWISDDMLHTACKAAEIHDYCLSLPNSYETVIGERGITLSGGQRQRLAIARSILSNAEILILDEATSALDPDTERRVQKNLDSIRSGKTTIVIAHRLSTIENADVIYVLKNSKIVQQGNYTDLIKEKSHFYELSVTRSLNEMRVSEC